MLGWLRFLSFVTLVSIAATSAADAADYPNKPVRLIVGFLPGAGSDLSARIVAAALGAQLGQPVVVENRPGAGSMIGVQGVARARPDGYTLLHTNSDGISMLPAIRSEVPYAIPKDFSFITRIVQFPLVVTVNAQLPIHSMAELIAYAKANPGKLHYGTSGVGTASHLASLLLEKEAGISMTHVPYKGSAGALPDLFGGSIDLAFPAVQTIAAQAGSGKVRFLAVTGAKRDPLMSEVPTLVELGFPSSTMVVWYGLMGPPALPPDVLAKLRTDAVAALSSPDSKRQFEKVGLEPAPLAGDDFEKFVVEDYNRWKAIGESEHIHIDD